MKIIKNYIQCDVCQSQLSYDNEETYVSYNWDHTHRVLYIDCQKCGNTIAIKRIE